MREEELSYHLFSESFPKARKIHRCIWCGETILVGQEYRRENSVYDGRFQDHAWHLECNEDAADYFASDEDEFLPYSAERPRPIDKVTPCAS